MSQNSPNVLVILTDDQGYADLGCHGNPWLRTPEMDRLHGESTRLSDFHVGPTCAPTRSTLITGHYANSTGVWHTIGGRSLLREDEWTMARAFQDAGYRTGLFGKWHLGDNFPYRPMDRGFERSVTHGGGGISQTPDHWGNDYFDDTYIVNGEPQRFEGYCTDVWFRLADAFMAEQVEDRRPFFCMLTPNAPHSPYNVDSCYSEPYRRQVPEDRARFYGMIANIDENLGWLRQRMVERGRAEDTIVVFMTDNGTSGGATRDEDGHIIDGFNAGMRGTKGSAYEGGHRTPCWFHWPAGGLARGRDIDELTASVDIMPTLLDLASVPVPEGRTFHGTSLAPLLRGEPQPELAERIVVTDSQRVPDPIKWKDSSAMRGKWRLINGEALYNLADDPGQRRDVADRHPEMVEALRAGYESWWSLVSVRFDQPVPIRVRRDMPTELTCHDWRNDEGDCPWHQGLIRQGMVSNGYWELLIVRAGLYRVELRRWPAEASSPVDGSSPPVEWRRDAISDRWADWYEGGVALAIHEGRVRVGDRAWAGALDPDADAIAVDCELEDGYCELMTEMVEADGTTRGAYYVRIIPPGVDATLGQ